MTHEQALRQCRAQVREFLGQVAGLGEKLRVLLVQTPGSLEFEPAVVRRFFAALVAAAPCHIVCEPRHVSWFSSSAEDTLRRYGIGRVAADPAKVPWASEPGGAGSLIYYRLHGSPKMYYSAYTAEYLKGLSEEVRFPDAECEEVWCVFDNTARHASWDNALELQRLVGLRRPRRAPATRRRSFPPLH